MEKELHEEGKAMDAKRLDILRLELEGAVDLDEGKGDEGLRLLRQAADLEESLPVPFGPPFIEKPSHEMLGEALLSVSRPAEAAKAFEGALARAPLRSRSLLGLARAQGHTGETEKSRRTYAELADSTPGRRPSGRRPRPRQRFADGREDPTPSPGMEVDRYDCRQTYRLSPPAPVSVHTKLSPFGRGRGDGRGLQGS
jgi:hypothetical protein